MRTVVTSALVLVCVAACASPARLNDETRTEPYASLLRRGEAIGSCYFETEFLPWKGELFAARRMPCFPRPGRTLVVLQPGILADHRTWRFLAPLLAEHYDDWAVDPPGTGQSWKPDPDSHPAPVYTPEWIGAYTLQAIHEHQVAHRDPRPVVLVGHSLGSAAIVRALTDAETRARFPELCARVTHLVLIAFPDVGERDPSPIIDEIASLSAFEAGVGDAVGILDASIDQGTWDSVVHPERRALRQESARLHEMLAGRTTRRAAQAMIRRFRPVDANGRPLWPEVRKIEQRERSLRIPTLVLWGARDETAPVSMAREVMSRLQGARLEIIQDAKHSPHQERPDLCLDAIRRHLASGRPGR